FVGQPIAALDGSDTRANLDKAEADLEAEILKLNQITSLNSNSDTELVTTKRSVVATIKDSFSKADDSIRNHADKYFDNPRTTPYLNIGITDDLLRWEVNTLRREVESPLSDWQTNVTNLNENSDLKSVLDQSKTVLNKVNTFLNKLSYAINSLSTSATVDAYKTDIATARTNASTAFSNVVAADEKLRSIMSEVPLQEIKVRSYQAIVDNYKAQLDKTVIYAPFNGVVTKQEAKLGQTASTNVNLVSVMSDYSFEIEAYIPEADIAKIKVGDEGSVTLDAYGSSNVFAVKVASIEPAETVIDGVSTYKTKLNFVKEDERIKSGMTANIDIVSEKRQGVLSLPQRVITNKNGSKYVLVDFGGGKNEERKIETGLVGSNGSVEILSGLQKGDKVLVKAK
ncbi:efflux RND transporter periplasmic adaptor subunit, partial [Candidatus Nomurabacteria bacterium]|nr:efflux RND transporter periplasmic adaptor subunit [Candidatus Nomurabacteria bacterium]